MIRSYGYREQVVLDGYAGCYLRNATQFIKSSFEHGGRKVSVG